MSSGNQVKYTVTEFKSQYKTLKQAKAAFNIKARSWSALVEKLNAPSYEQLKEQVAKLLRETEVFRRENETFNQSISKTKQLDKIGFWLINNNFDRSKLSYFGVPEEATEIKSSAK